jgi:hypothetical protein
VLRRFELAVEIMMLEGRGDEEQRVQGGAQDSQESQESPGAIASSAKHVP